MKGGAIVDMRPFDGAPYDHAIGDKTALAIPAHPDALLAAGPEFLTAAFHAFGSLDVGNRVTRIVRAEPCRIGSTGEKLFLTLAYAHAGPETQLFAKFSRNFDDPVRDRRRAELAPEINLAELSRVADLGIAVPQAMFADYAREDETGLLITRKVPFGQGGIEPLHHKCMDHRLENPAEYYRTIVTALARLAAAHRSGALDPHVDALFPYDRDIAAAEDPIGWNEAELRDLVARYADLVRQSPQLFPAPIRTSAFLDRLADEVPLVAANQTAIKRYLQSNGDLIALSHFNPQIDNAWFWRDAAGVLQCGLLDWQRARQMNVAYALWGGLSGMGPDRFADNLEPMLGLFAKVYHRYGGPAVTIADLREHLVLYAATIGLAGLMETPAIILARLPGAIAAASACDPIFDRDEMARAFLHVFTNFLTLWEATDFAAILARTNDE